MNIDNSPTPISGALALALARWKGCLNDLCHPRSSLKQWLTYCRIVFTAWSNEIHMSFTSYYDNGMNSLFDFWFSMWRLKSALPRYQPHHRESRKIVDHEIPDSSMTWCRWTSTSCSNLLYAEWFHNIPDFIHGFTMVFEATDSTAEWYKNHWGNCISHLNERIEPDRGICIIQDPNYANDSFRLSLGFHDKLQATITISGPIFDDFICIWLWHVYRVNFLWWATS